MAALSFQLFISQTLNSLTPYTQPLRNSEFQFQNKLIIWPFYTISYFPGHSDHCFLLEVQKVCYGASVYTEKNSKSSSWPPRASGPPLLLNSFPVTLSFFYCLWPCWPCCRTCFCLAFLLDVPSSWIVFPQKYDTFFFFFFFLAALCSLWDLSSPTRDWTHYPCSGSMGS